VQETKKPEDQEAPEELKEVDCETSNNYSANEDAVAPGGTIVQNERDNSNDRAVVGAGNKVPPIMVN